VAATPLALSFGSVALSHMGVDEFTNYQDAGIGQKALLLLSSLGYEVAIQKHPPSARTYLSKGFVKKASKIATSQVMIFKDRISSDEPLIGIEPSAILGFRDEFPDLVNSALRKEALELGRNCLMIDEFLATEMRAGRIQTSQFTDDHKEILLHGHCHQKALSTTIDTVYVLNFPENYSCSEIPSGCCGMAGAFGFEKEHYELSMKVGEMVLFPAVRKADSETIICAPGTSCRHQIKDGTGKKVLHPVEILFDALRQ
jgi:Fe-S oxidoreductase